MRMNAQFRGTLQNFFFFTGSVDAFAAVLGQRDSGKQDEVSYEIFIFDIVNVNIRGGYNSTTGLLF